jgi:RNA polymerase sigma-70 factor, ECF subfamily
MSKDSRREVRAGLDPCLILAWRAFGAMGLYCLAGDLAEALVYATCKRAFERADQFVPGSRLDRWMFAILRSIWVNEIRARRISKGGGFVGVEDPLRTEGEQAVEMNILAADGFHAIGPLPEAQRETVLLVYGEGYGYAEAQARSESRSAP